MWAVLFSVSNVSAITDKRANFCIQKLIWLQKSIRQKVLNPEDVPQRCDQVLKVVNNHEEEMAGCCSDEDMDDLDKKDDDDDEEEVKFFFSS
jgi:hypothetical protein